MRISYGGVLLSYLDSGHCNCRRSCLGHKAVCGAPLHQVPCVWHVLSPIGTKHKVFPERINQHYHHSLKKGVWDLGQVWGAPCKCQRKCHSYQHIKGIVDNTEEQMGKVTCILCAKEELYYLSSFKQVASYPVQKINIVS